MLLRSKRGMTLIELLAVIVILGIVSSIVVIAVLHIIEKSKERAFVSDAYTLYEAARLYVGAEKVEFLPSRSSVITYKQLVEEGMLHPIQDPFTGNVLSLETNPSYVLVKKDEDGSLHYSICLKGETKQLCTYSEQSPEVPVEALSVQQIRDR
ncbi:type II secretion system protein [Geobacillus sp. NFOSA3]|jgi:general secretion pathway protein G|uniref:General secretion pathway protein G n=1 Tax=Parageobacillus toebii NBRC 107807 TaxID=1223503 RepID=A0A6G9IYQ4_9BACL|nr:type II secretion system protein [Parageobacillus toebii]NNU93226.1 type II secretion system protein [Geobacillus sp. NFOSA3]OQP01371.1 pilus assembly protein PilE [Geobacillus sp. 44C]MBB3867606.1 general secretion pathway protein G [Parageobacillus toebii NBRC 107807]QIQ31573.1 type II secretion system protein [Parageobacillus toebii NBRC 107807]QNU35200.1 type II secretion system protein [Geobacillus sp. 44C]